MKRLRITQSGWMLLAIGLLAGGVFTVNSARCADATTSTEPAFNRTGLVPAELYQVSTLPALQAGLYDGVVSIADLLQRGEFGIGTLTGLNGELIIVSGEAWQIRFDGVVVRVPHTQTTPFANIASGMLPGVSMRAKSPLRRRDDALQPFSSFAELQKQLKGRLFSDNLPHLLVIEGTFSQMQTRSVAVQQKPYPPLAEVAAKQSVFRMENVKGVLVGFWFPRSFAGLNLPGFHLHFLSDDRKSGGHLLDCAGTGGYSSVYPQFRFSLRLPDSVDFERAPLTKNDDAELQRIEGRPADKP